MRKIYLLMLAGVFSGGLMAQSITTNTTTTTNTGTKKNSNETKGTVAKVTSVATSNQQESLPGFPVKKNADNGSNTISYNVAKEHWIQLNTDLWDAYQFMQTRGIEFTFNLPDYPVYIVTGNDALDFTNYQTSLNQWLSKNPGKVQSEIRRMNLSNGTPNNSNTK